MLPSPAGDLQLESGSMALDAEAAVLPAKAPRWQVLSGVRTQRYVNQLMQICNKKTPKFGDFLVELIRKSLHQIINEVKRWKSILINDYERYKLTEENKKWDKSLTQLAP